jgi:hypothetical protein
MEEKRRTGLDAFRWFQEPYPTAQYIEETDNVGEQISSLMETFDPDVDANLSVAGSRVGNSEALADCVTALRRRR